MKTRILLFSLFIFFLIHTASSQDCVTFESLIAGTPYGYGINTSGQQIFTENNIHVNVYDFSWTTTTGTFGTGMVLPADPEFGDGNIMSLNNLNLVFFFDTMECVPQKVTFNYAHLGGFENLWINGPLSLYIGELTTATVPTGFSISVITTPITGGIKGTVTITGPVENLLVGGQELYLDSICVYCSVGVDDHESASLMVQNYPNPMSNSTGIHFQTASAGNVVLEIISNTGKEIKTLSDAFYPAGNHAVTWDGTDRSGNRVAPGLYFCKVLTEKNVVIRKINLIRE